jgi:hypothetical protein
MLPRSNTRTTKFFKYITLQVSLARISSPAPFATILPDIRDRACKPRTNGVHGLATIPVPSFFLPRIDNNIQSHRDALSICRMYSFRPRRASIYTLYRHQQTEIYIIINRVLNFQSSAVQRKCKMKKAYSVYSVYRKYHVERAFGPYTSKLHRLLSLSLFRCACNERILAIALLFPMTIYTLYR